MAAANTDKLRKTYSFLSKTLNSSITAGDTTLTPNNVTNIPTDTAVSFVIDRVDSNGNLTPTTRELMTGYISGGTITGLLRGEQGTTAQSHAAGAVIEFVNSGEMWNDLIDAILAEHSQTGAHTAVTATSVTASATVQGATVVATGDIQHRSVSLETIRANFVFDHVASGCIWSGDSYGSTRAASMTSGVVYIGGKRVAVSAVSARTFTASKDTYIDVDNAGTITYTEVSNNAASPALTASNVRIGIIITAAGSIANVGSVNQGQQDKVLPIASSIAYSVTDSLGNLICPRDPNRRVLGYRQIIANDANTGAVSVTTGLTCAVIVPTGRRVRVTAWAQDIGNSTSPFDVYLAIYDGTISGGGTQLALGAATIPSNNYLGHPTASAVTTPATASKTYEVGHSSGSGNATLHASATCPAYILVELE